MAVKRNLTIQLDEEVIEQVKAVTARRGTSVSGLVAADLSQLAAENDDYERARKRALELMDQEAYSKPGDAVVSVSIGSTAAARHPRQPS